MTYYRTNINDDEGVFIDIDECINILSDFQSVIHNSYQRLNENRESGFYKIINDNKTIYLVTMDILFEMVQENYGRPSLKELKVSGGNDNTHYYYNINQNIYNNNLIGYSETSRGEKEYYTMSLTNLPQNVLYCHRNIN